MVVRAKFHETKLTEQLLDPRNQDPDGFLRTPPQRLWQAVQSASDEEPPGQEPWTQEGATLSLW